MNRRRPDELQRRGTILSTAKLGLILVLGLAVSGCQLNRERINEDDFRRMVDEALAEHAKAQPAASSAPGVPVAPLRDRIALPSAEPGLKAGAEPVLYSFVAQNLPVQQALQIFARAYKLNIVTDSDITGRLTVEFYDLPFEQAMQALLETAGLYWVNKGDLIHVKSWETKVFAINYVRLVRSGSGVSQAQVSSSTSTEGGSGGEEAGTIAIEQKDSVAFWDELEAQLDRLRGPNGRVVVNRMAGTVQVTDRHPNVKRVEQFVAQINQAIHRQVDIDVRIVEVALNDDFSLGIDWSRVTGGAPGRVNTDFSVGTIVGQPAGGFAAKLPSLALNIFEINGSTLSFSAMLDALHEQGQVKVVSQPKIRTLNNQSALIKVGTDRTFFRRELLTDTTSAGSTTQTTDVPQVVTEGVVLSITPQISADGWIMMDVSPVVTRVSSVSEVRDSGGNLQSSAPNLDIRQASSLVRVRSGETVVIGGLIQDQTSDTERSIPGLADVPLVGDIFRGNYQIQGKRELVILLTARVVSAGSIAVAQN